MKVLEPDQVGDRICRPERIRPVLGDITIKQESKMLNLAGKPPENPSNYGFASMLWLEHGKPCWLLWGWVDPSVVAIASNNLLYYCNIPMENSQFIDDVPIHPYPK